MENLSVNQLAVVNTIKTNDDPIYNTVHKNLNYYSNKSLLDHYNKTKLTILHQNIQGIINKADEFLISLFPNVPQIICLSEHHLRTDEISKINFSQSTVGTFLSF
jgi:hypothetical protein